VPAGRRADWSVIAAWIILATSTAIDGWHTAVGTRLLDADPGLTTL
jgi:hypothetical protein